MKTSCLSSLQDLDTVSMFNFPGDAFQYARSVKRQVKHVTNAEPELATKIYLGVISTCASLLIILAQGMMVKF